MERVGPDLRELEVSVRDHMAVSFYEGEDAARATWLVNGEENEWGVPRTTYPRMIRPEEGAVYEFTVWDPSS